MSPLELSICLHYHSSCEDMPWVTSDAPIVDDTMNRLINADLLTRIDGKTIFLPTERLHRFVEMLCTTPLPEQRMHWYDPRTNEVIDNLRGSPLPGIEPSV